MKITKNTMKNGHIFQFIRTEFLIIGDSGSGKTKTLLNLINEQMILTKLIYMQEI